VTTVQQLDSQRVLLQRRWAALRVERSSWFEHWREISDFLLPRSGRFLTTDRNRGEKRHNNIYDSTGTKALRVLSAGMMSGMTSPARPWFRLATSDPDLMESDPVKFWLDDVSELMRTVFERSNTYRALHTQYEELGAFGTSADIILSNFQRVVHHYPLTIGEYAIGTNAEGEVTTLYREFDMTVSQIVRQFGLQNCSDTVKALWDRQQYDQWVPVIHAIEPREERDLQMYDARSMAFASCYIESGSDKPEQMLRCSGFKRFPGIVPRWAVSGGDIYGNSPGMESLGDVKQLQHEQIQKGTGIDYMVKPPLQVPSSYKNTEVNYLPGGVTFIDSAGQNAGIREAMKVNLDLNHLLADIQDVRQRINSTFFSDLFLLISNDQRSDITAREIAERHEEKMLMLGPVLERLHNEMLSPLIDVTFEKMVDAHIIPPPPQEMQGMELKVEFVSVLAQAQRAVGLSSMDRLLGTVGQMAQFKPEVLDKLDTDEIVDRYADMLGVDPQLIVADDKVALIRADRAKQQQQAQAAAMAPQAAQTAKTLSETDTEGKNALTDTMNRLTGYNGNAA